ncbi:MAG: Y-family DNA polymerase [Pseudomonadota bacterium]
MSVVALLDCNHFYCACEQLFRPDLHDRPVVVLSNNDGCIVARSPQAKALGVPMAAPYFKHREMLRRGGVHIFSSNYRLYGDMSARVMSIIRQHSCAVEVYSIDEAFFRLDDDPMPIEQGHKIRTKVQQWTGLPVSIGIGPNKTLAKVAGHKAKHEGVYDLCDPAEQADILKDLSVGKVWGVGRKMSTALMATGIMTAGQLRAIDPHFIRREYGVRGERIVRELRGMTCIDAPDEQGAHSLISSRSFGQVVTDRANLLSALAEHVMIVAEKLRHQGGYARALSIFLRGDPPLTHPSSRPLLHPSQGSHRAHKNTLRVSKALDFAHPTADTSRLLAAMRQTLMGCYVPGGRYRKVGVALCVTHSLAQEDFFSTGDDPNRRQLLDTIDQLNQRLGHRVVRFATGSMPEAPWHPRRDFASPCYTTDWKDLPVVSCHV